MRKNFARPIHFVWLMVSCWAGHGTTVVRFGLDKRVPWTIKVMGHGRPVRIDGCFSETKIDEPLDIFTTPGLIGCSSRSGMRSFVRIIPPWKKRRCST